MTINQIYQQYQTPANLQQHMRRVAALAGIITQNWIGESLNEQAIIRACLLHDLAKPITFDLAKQTQYGMSQIDVDRLAQLQLRWRSQYGDIDEHMMVIKMCQDIGCDQATIKLVDHLEWKNISTFLVKSDLESLIPIYCDMRITPAGLTSLAQRVTELSQRTTDVPDLDQLLVQGNELESALQNQTNIDLSQVTGDQIEHQASLFTAWII